METIAEIYKAYLDQKTFESMLFIVLILGFMVGIIIFRVFIWLYVDLPYEIRSYLNKKKEKLERKRKYERKTVSN